jgi:2-C-methyl-D-erythritol 4-phosphate cytidylyltransferase
MKVHLVVGEEQNIKITQPIDLLLAEGIINAAGEK